MCDYSLHNVASRPAKVGDKLVSTDFARSITRGFSAVDDPSVAVCLLPGTELAFERDVRYDRAFSLFGTAKVECNTARFTKVNEDDPLVHHDALAFPNGQTVLLTRLLPWQRATVLQLPTHSKAPIEPVTALTETIAPASPRSMLHSVRTGHTDTAVSNMQHGVVPRSRATLEEVDR